MNKKRILLVNPPSSVAVYSKSKIKAAIGQRPLISLAALAGYLLKEKCEVNIIDLIFSRDPIKDLKEKIRVYDPEYIGITFTTPLFNEAKILVDEVKKEFPDIIAICGGVHTSIMPKEVLENTQFDIAVIGEGDITLSEIVSKKRLSSIKGIMYKNKDKIIKNDTRPLIKDLDELPYPAFELYDIKKYINPILTARKNPVGTIETSRGCVYGCIYCNKSVFGRNFRYKSPKRVVDEMEHLIKLGFGELHIWDDNFATNLDRAKEICNELIKRGSNIIWRMECGVRCDCIDEEFFVLAKKAGCYGVSFGYESGNDEILKNINKGETIEQMRKATKWAKKAGLMIYGFFMFGLPGETIDTMNQTIKFAKELDPDYAKFTITVPFPSTKLFDDWEKEGIIKTKDWSRYNFHTASKVYDHPSINWDILEKYYNWGHIKFYFRPKYVIKRVFKDIKDGTIHKDIYYAIKTFL